MGVNEMTRFGFGPDEFDRLAELMADCILNNADVGDEVAALRSDFTEMQYCFGGKEFDTVLENFAEKIGL